MTHITIQELPDGMFQLTPDKGYQLRYGDSYYSEAIVKNTKGWSAEKI